MSFVYDSDGMLQFEEIASSKIDRCPHDVPDDCPCVDCDEEDAHVENLKIFTLETYRSLFRHGAA